MTTVADSVLAGQDPEIFDAIRLEEGRQRNKLEMIASENYTSPAVLEAVGSVLTNKYAEGYPGSRYYGGCEYVDIVENLARVCKEKLGVVVRLGVRVASLRADGDRIDGVVTSEGVMTADSYVLALGVGAPRVAETAGVSLPIYPAKGYSSTFPLKPGGLAPTVPGVDEKWLVGWSRLGDRLRLTSTAELPSSTTPSVAILSPGRTTNTSPTVRESTGTRCSSPSRSTETSFAPNSNSARSAAPARRLDRASK